jgi:hypothetical protein
MMNVRRASQIERGDLEVELLTLATRASIAAARERYAAEVRVAQATIDVLRETLSVGDIERGSPAEQARRRLEFQDRLRMIEVLRDAAASKDRRLAEVQVVTAAVDFELPREAQIPLSWTLTGHQQRNLDAAWVRIVDGHHPQQPLRIIDSIFSRIEPAEAATDTSSASFLASWERNSSGRPAARSRPLRLK